MFRGTRFVFGLLATLSATPISAQTALQKKMTDLAAAAQGSVSVSCSLPGTDLNCDLNPHAHPPMQSVFKWPLAMFALHRMEQDHIPLDRTVRFRAADRILPKTYSPLQDRFPNGEVDVPLQDLLQAAVSLSDNTAADILLRFVGGPAPVTDYIRSLGAEGFRLQDGEAALHRVDSLQYRNWFEPAAAVALLRRLDERSPLTPEHTKLLLGWMRDSPTGPHRIKGQLPEGTVVFHKTGTSGTHAGLTAANNDVGLIVLPDERHLTVAIFVTDSRADETTREGVMAQIARAIYDEAIKQ